MENRLKNNVIIVVGATGGIGQALVPLLSQAGARVVLVARDLAKLQLLAATLPDGTYLIQPTDICVYDQVQQLMDATMVEYGQVDGLVNSAGVGILKAYNKLTSTDIQQMLAVNLQGCFYTSQLAAEAMKEKRQGHICNVVGILGKHSMAMAAGYCASKFGVVGFSKSMAEELKRYGIKMSLFYFGGIDSPFWDQISLKVDRTKMLRPETAAEAILFAMQAEPQAIPLEINIQPDSHLFF